MWNLLFREGKRYNGQGNVYVKLHVCAAQLPPFLILYITVLYD